MPAIRKTKSKRYQLDFTLFGHRIRTNFFEEAHAKDFKKRLIQSLPVRQVSVEESIRIYLQNETDKRKTSQTKIMERLWFYELKTFLRDECGIGTQDYISTVTRFHLEQFQASLIKNGSSRGRVLKSSSVNRRFHAIKNLFKKLDDWGFIPENHAIHVRKLPEKVSRRARWTPAEFQEVITSPRLTLLDRDIAHFLVNTGMRLGSALDMRAGDVRFEERTLIVRQRKGGHGESEYMIPIAPALEETVRRRLVGSTPADFLFRDSIDERISLHMISQRFSRLFARIGKSHLTLHGLRHTFASRLHVAGASTETIRQLLGHRNARTTQDYLHTEFDHLRKWLK